MWRVTKEKGGNFHPPRESLMLIVVDSMTPLDWFRFWLTSIFDCQSELSALNVIVFFFSKDGERNVLRLE